MKYSMPVMYDYVRLFMTMYDNIGLLEKEIEQGHFKNVSYFCKRSKTSNFFNQYKNFNINYIISNFSYFSFIYIYLALFTFLCLCSNAASMY